MKNTVAIGLQSFSKIREQNCFLIDKTNFIKDWWESKDDVTLVTRPRRFGKTLNMSMLNCFFSNEYENRSDLFEGLDIWNYEEYRAIQGTYPVIFLSFAEVKENMFENSLKKFGYILFNLYDKYKKIINDSNNCDDIDKSVFNEIMMSLKNETNESVMQTALKSLCKYLSLHYKQKVIVLLDEYDTPLQEAWVNGYWDKAVSFMRLFFNSTFKTNEFMYRSVLTGITRVSKESLFSDLNNLEVCAMTAEKYQTYFGFTEEEVFSAMDEYGYTNKEEVKNWYDGFTIGKVRDIYNPWSIINFLDKGVIKPYWANTSSNALVSRLVREGNRKLKMDFENLLKRETVVKVIDEEMVFNQLSETQNAVWSLLVASGYLKIDVVNENEYKLQIVNYEVMHMFRKLIREWFGKADDNYSDFITSMIRCDADEMNEYMSCILSSVISSFDTADSETEFLAPEKFYHGLVLGLLVELRDKYAVQSNRESGFGRYDVMLIPKNVKEDKAFIIEFKVVNKKRGEKNLEDAMNNALKQIEEKKYEQQLIDMGIAKGNIVKYGFAFESKNVLIGKA